jgi:AraC family transcriptional regulator
MAITLSFHADAYQAGTRHPPHSHDALHMSLVLGGRVAETVGSVTEYAGALSVVVKDAGVVHADSFGTAGAKLARLILPFGTIGTLVDDPGRSADWRWTHDARVANPFLRLVHRAKGGVRSFDADDPDLLDLLAAFTARPAPLTRGRPPAWLEQTMSDLRSSWHPGLTVADVARRAGVHPVYLARTVRRWFGTGVGEEIRRLRIRSAAAQIAENCGTVSTVAHSRGFSDEPHLCREFLRSLGTTPGRYRTLVRELDYQRGRP